MMYLKLILLFYASGVLTTLIVGFEGISKHITWKGLRATFILSLFSFFALLYIMLGGSKKYNDY